MTLYRLNNIIGARHRGGFESTLFKTEWTTTTPSENVVIPLRSGFTYDFDYRVNGGAWINHTSDTLTIVAPINGINQIDFDPKGTGLPAWYQNNGGDKLKMTKISQFGTNVWQSLSNAFWGCSNLVVTATDEIDVSACTNLVFFAQGCSSITQIVTTNWNLTSCTNLTRLFTDCTSLTTIDTSNWDVSNVTSINASFRNVPAHIDISTWQLTSCVNAVDFLLNTNVTTPIYDAFWILQDTLTLQSGVSFNGGTSTYTLGGAAEAARTSVITNDSWTVTDGGGI